MWSFPSSRFAGGLLICLLVTACNRQYGATAILFLTSTVLSKDVHSHFAISNARDWNAFSGCVCERKKLCSVDFDYVNYYFTTFQYKNIISLNTSSPGGNRGTTTTTTNDTIFVCKMKRWRSGYLECNPKEGYDNNTMSCSAAACPYFLGISCSDNTTVPLAWDCSQRARVLMHNSGHVNLIPSCPRTTQTTVPTTSSTSSSSIITTTMAKRSHLTITTTTNTAERNASGLDDKKDDKHVVFTGLHIGVIVAVSLASVVATLIIVTVVWRLRKKQNGKVPTAPQTKVSSDSHRDNDEHKEYVKANPVYGYTFSSTDTDVQPYSIGAVEQYRSEIGNYTDIELPQ